MFDAIKMILNWTEVFYNKDLMMIVFILWAKNILITANSWTNLKQFNNKSKINATKNFYYYYYKFLR